MRYLREIKINRIIILLFAILLAGGTEVIAQGGGTKVYFNKIGKSSSKSSSYYYRVKGSGSNKYESFYVNGGAKYFEGNIIKVSNTNEANNVYEGKCVWYFRNGQEKAMLSYNEKGRLHGQSRYYYQSGKIWKEIDYDDGDQLGLILEYDESGGSSRIFKEDFNENKNDWDLYASSSSNAEIEGGVLKIESFTDKGTSRFIPVDMGDGDFSVEVMINVEDLKTGSIGGIIYGFKDWDNYNYFLVSSDNYYYLGSVYEGITATKADKRYTGAIKAEGFNRLQVLTKNGDCTFSINGEIQYTKEAFRNYGSNCGVGISGKSTVLVEKMIVKELSLSNPDISEEDKSVKSTGSGLVVGKKGYIITNFHVVDGAAKLVIELNDANNKGKSLNAKVVLKDKEGDLALLKIDDPNFVDFTKIGYGLRSEGILGVGTEVFTIGYPYALAGMGKEAKFADGKISSKTGYNGAIDSYQTTIPVQPGNSGGPLFDNNGKLSGLVNAKIQGADNVSYAIKVNYVRNLLELMDDPMSFDETGQLSGYSLEEKIKVLTNYVAFIKIK
ncbi:MAG: serine protease [Bacteroidetes bacterium]|nr:serine protease [Bacteroidota bacterium]